MNNNIPEPNTNQGPTIQPQNNLNITQSINPQQEALNNLNNEQPVQQVIQPEPKKQGKGSNIVIVLLILIILGLAGYICYDKFISKDNKCDVEETAETDIIKTNTNTEVVVKKDKDKDIVYTDISTSKHNVPQINIDSEIATKYNKEIMTFYNDFKSGKGLALSADEYNFGYKYYINDEIVSVVVSHTTESGAENPTKVYNINQYTGKEVSNSELLKKLNITENDVANKLNKSYDVIETIGLYLNNNKLYIVFDRKTIAGAEHQQSIFDYSDEKIIDIYETIIK